MSLAPKPGRRTGVILLVVVGLLAACSATDHTLVAKSHNEAGRLDDAVASAKEALALDPRHAPAWYWLGVTRYEQKRWDEVIEAFKKVIELRSEGAQLVDSHRRLGYAYLQKGQNQEAASILRRATELDSKNPVIHHNLGAAYVRLGRHEEAVRALARALELDPADKDGSSRSFLGQAYLGVGKQHLGAGQYRQAIDAVRKSLELEAPRDGEKHFVLGQAHLGLGEQDVAIQALRRSIELGDTTERFVGLGVQIGSVGGVPTVESVFEGSPASRAGLRIGDQIVAVNGTDTSGVPVEELVRRLAGAAGSRVRIGVRRLDGETKEIDIVRAEVVYPRARALLQFAEQRRRAVTDLSERGQRADQTGRPREALEHYREALRLAGSGPQADTLREQIIAVVQKLPAVPPVGEEVERRLVRARILMDEAKGPADYERAAAELRAVLGLAPWWAGAYFNLGLLYEKLGRYAEAAQHLRLYLKADPGSTQATTVRQKIYELELRHERTGGRGR